MILDKSRLSIVETSKDRVYTYDFPSEDKKINIFLFALIKEGQIEYHVCKVVNDLQNNNIVSSEDTMFDTTDLKAAWEKFEDYFEETQKEENPQQGGEEPEVQILCMSVNKNGHSYVFLQKEDGTQELLFELDIDNYDIINTKPKFATLDFTGNASIKEPFNTEWALGLVDDITFADAQIDSTTYVVALKSIDQPGQNQEGEPQDNKEGKQEDKRDKGEPKDDKGDKGEPKDDKGDKGEPKDDKGDKGEPKDDKGDKGEPKDDKGDKGEPKDDKGDKGEPKDDKGDKGDDKKDDKRTPPDGPNDGRTPPDGPNDGRTPPDGPDDGKGKPTDDKEKPGDDKQPKPGEPQQKVTPIEFSLIVKEISDKTGLSPDNIEAALRTERTFDTFLTLQKVNVNELKDKLNASALTRNQFIKQVVNDFKKI